MRALSLLAAMLLVAACAGSPKPSGTPASTEAPSTAAATSAASSPAIETPSPSNVPALAGYILFTRTTGNDVQAIFMANADGTGEQQLTQPGEYCCLSRISPDHARILVLPGQDPLPTPVTGGTLSIDGSGFVRLRLKDPTLNLVPQAWSPDGTRIAFEGWDESDPSRTGVYTARASDGGDLVRVTARPGLPHDQPLDYSPDGKQLVFHRALKAEPETDIDLGGSLWVVNVDGTNARKFEMPGTMPDWWARWSPDGTKILFSTARAQPTGELWTIYPDGSNVTKIFEDSEGRFALQPTWSPDGTQIMFALDPIADAFQHPPNGLYVIRADGTGLTLVIGGSDFKRMPEWWP